MTDFNLENAVNEWKRSLTRQQGLEPGVIEELAANLYDRIEEYLEDGYDEELAFKQALLKTMPHTNAVADEFYKAGPGRKSKPPWQRKQYFWNSIPLHFKVAVRNMKKRKAYSMLNIGGLAVSICTAALIWFYIQDQSSYDRHYKDADRIYRVINDVTLKNRTVQEARASLPVGPTLVNDYPEVVEFGRIRRIGAINTVETGSMKIDSEDIFAAETEFLTLFDIPFSAGSVDGALDEPNSIVLSESMARLLFGKVQAVGETLTYSGVSAPREMKVTGVFPDLDRRTHLPFKALVPIGNFFPEEAFTTWWQEGVYTYIKLNSSKAIKGLEAKIPGFSVKYFDPVLERYGAKGNFLLQPLRDIHLDEEYIEEPYPHSSRSDLKILTAIMAFLLVMSSINYVNMSTARSVDRALEVGIKKTLGSSRGSLFAQFIVEALLLAIMAGLLAVVLSVILYRPYTLVTNLDFSLSELMTRSNLMNYFIVSVLIGFISGVYPSLYMSSFKPIAVLKGKFSTSKKGLSLRKSLIVIQYIVSLVLISVVITIAFQIHYIKTKDIGYSKDNLIQLPIPNDTLVNQRSFTLMDQIRDLPGIRGAALSHSGMHSIRNSNLFSITNLDGEPTRVRLRSPNVGDDFAKTIGASIIEGRDFVPAMSNERTFILNQAAMEKYGWTDFSTLKWSGWGGDQDWRCIGIVADFNLGESHKEKVPMILIHNSNPVIDGSIFVGADNRSISEVLFDIEQIWHGQFPDHRFEFELVEDKLNALYKGENLFLNQVLFLGSTILFVTVIGIVGLISFTTQLRRKEIAVRKVNGASIGSILSLLARQFFWLIIAAMVIAIPSSVFLSEQWLNNFEEHVNLGFWPHLIALPLCVLFTAFSVGFHTYRAARENPVDALRLD